MVTRRCPAALVALAACHGGTERAPVATKTPEPTAGAVPSSAAQPRPPTANAPVEPVAIDPEDVIVDLHPTADGAPAELYADLFAVGTTWLVTRDQSSASTKMSETPQVQKSTSKLRCSVRSAEVRAWAIVSIVECPGLAETLVGPDPISGVWIATSVGLFHVAADSGSAPPPLTRASLVLLAEPQPEEIEHVDPDSRFGPVWSKSTTRIGVAWCTSVSSAAGDATQRSACFEPGRGFVRASSSAVVGLSAWQSAFVLVKTVTGKPVL